MASNEGANPDRKADDRQSVHGFFGRAVGRAKQFMQASASRETAADAHGESRESDGVEGTLSWYQTRKHVLDDQAAADAVKTLAAVATAVWRAKVKLDQECKAVLPAELRHLPRHIQAACDALAAGHVQVHDPTGQRYVPGMAVNVLTFQPLPGIGAEVVHETIKPTVYFRDMLVQRADIIVARPLTESEGISAGSAHIEGAEQEGSTVPQQEGQMRDGSDND